MVFEWSLLFILALCCHDVFCGQQQCDDDSWYLIRSTASNLVVDGGNLKMTIQHFDGYAPQLWKFKRGSNPGLFFIINNSTGKVLDVGHHNMVMLTTENDASLEQQWYVHSNGRIVNAGKKLNLDILQAKYIPGNPLGVVSDNGNAAQQFIVKEKITCGK